MINCKKKVNTDYLINEAKRYCHGIKNLCDANNRNIIKNSKNRNLFKFLSILEDTKVFYKRQNH